MTTKLIKQPIIMFLFFLHLKAEFEPTSRYKYKDNQIKSSKRTMKTFATRCQHKWKFQS